MNGIPPDHGPEPWSCLDRRRAGVVLHVTSLPGSGSSGTLGAGARRFVDLLADCGLTVWQTLPVGPTHEDRSPYQTASVHAGNALHDMYTGGTVLLNAGIYAYLLYRVRRASLERAERYLHASQKT